MWLPSILAAAVASQGGGDGVAGTPPTNFIDNGTFDDASGWTLGGGTPPTISGGTLNSTASGGTASRDTNVTIAANSWYKVVYDIVNGTGQVNMSIGGGVLGPLRAGIGSYVDYVQAGATQAFQVSPNGNISIDNLVVSGPMTVTVGPELIQNGTFDDETSWALGTNVSISGGALNFTSASSLRTAVNTPNPPGLEADSYYQLMFSLTSRTSGSVRLDLGSSGGTNANSVGMFTSYGYSSGIGAPTFRNTGTSTLSIDNASCKKITFS